MDVDPEAGGSRSKHRGATYHFCSTHCQAKFDADPAPYVLGSDRTPRSVESAAVSAGGEVEYTCPMHPEIRQPGPGACPICGMALEPVVVTADTGPSAELADMRRRFWIALVLSIPVVVLEMGGHLFRRCTSWCHCRCQRGSSWCWQRRSCCGRAGGFTRGWTSVRTLNLNMFTLIAMGTGVAWLFSVIATVAPGVFPDSFRGMGGVVDV